MADEAISCDREVDARGLNCPLPILRAKKALTDLGSGQVLKVVSTDPGSKRDFEAFARQTGHTLLRVERRCAEGVREEGRWRWLPRECSSLSARHRFLRLLGRLSGGGWARLGRWARRNRAAKEFAELLLPN